MADDPTIPPSSPLTPAPAPTPAAVAPAIAPAIAPAPPPAPAPEPVPTLEQATKDAKTAEEEQNDAEDKAKIATARLDEAKAKAKHDADVADAEAKYKASLATLKKTVQTATDAASAADEAFGGATSISGKASSDLKAKKVELDKANTDVADAQAALEAAQRTQAVRQAEVKNLEKLKQDGEAKLAAATVARDAAAIAKDKADAELKVATLNADAQRAAAIASAQLDAAKAKTIAARLISGVSKDAAERNSKK